MSLLRNVILGIGLSVFALACGGSDKKEDTTPASTETGGEEAAPAEGGEAAPAEGGEATPPADDTTDTGGGAEGGGAEGGGK